MATRLRLVLFLALLAVVATTLTSIHYFKPPPFDGRTTEITMDFHTNSSLAGAGNLRIVNETDKDRRVEFSLKTDSGEPIKIEPLVVPAHGKKDITVGGKWSGTLFYNKPRPY